MPLRVVNLLVVEDDIWQPDPLTGNIECFDATIIIWIPLEFIVVPLLQQHHSQEETILESSVVSDNIVTTTDCRYWISPFFPQLKIIYLGSY